MNHSTVNYFWLPFKNLIPKTIFLFLFCFLQNKLSSQFQTSIGHSFPVNERSVRGLQTNTGNYLLLTENTNHPQALFNPLGDLAHVELNASGALVNPSVLIGNDGMETAVWMEKTNCGSGGYIIAANQDNGTGSDIMITRTDLNCHPIWTRRAGLGFSNEYSSCIKEDGNGDFVLSGTRESNGIYTVQVLKLDCNGNQLWYTNYETTFSSISTSLTVFATQNSVCSNIPANYYITGTSVLPNGQDELFILCIQASTGNLVWMNQYDIAPNAAEYATCIQGSCLYNANLNGELWVSGYSTDGSSGMAQILLLKTDLSGNVIWSNNYEIVGDYEVVSHFDFNASGDLILTGRAESLLSPPRPAVKSGHCLLMKIANNGNQIFWTRLFDQGFASQGNSLDILAKDHYFISGYSYKADPPSSFDFNILAIKTDSLGQSGTTCYHNAVSDILKRNPLKRPVTPSLSSAIEFVASNFVFKNFVDTQIYCRPIPAPVPCDSIFSVINPIASNQNTCCFDLFSQNTETNYFNQIQLNLSSGTFLNVLPNTNWQINTIGNQMTIAHSNGWIPAAYNNPASFCISNGMNPVTLTISYFYNQNGLSGKCDEVLILNCPPLPFQACRCDSNSVAGPNLIQNGDFGLGNVGFQSNYIYAPPNLGLINGRYSVRNSTNLVNLSWACTDHTFGNPLGNFLVVDATTFAGSICWREIVNVNAGVRYSFCAFVNNLVNTLNNFTNPTVELWIFNTLQASVTLPEIPDNWVNLSANWTSAVTGAIPIEIRVGAPVHLSGSGCDFAVDDIAFHRCQQPVIFGPDTCCIACPANNANWNILSNQYYIHDMVVYDNKLIIGGEFTINGFNNLAAWDGSNWFMLGNGANGIVDALEVHNGKLYAGGSFSNIGTNIAEWNGPILTGSWTTSMSGLTGGSFNRVTSLLSTAQGLVAGGAFLNPVNNIGLWNGVNWANIGSSGITVPNTKSGGVHALGLFNGQLIAGGVLSPPLNNIAQLITNVWQNMGDGIQLINGNNGEGIKAIQQFDQNKLAVGGRFQEAVNSGNLIVPNTKFIAQWNGINWSSMSTGVNTSFEGIYDLKIHCGNLYAGGLFSQIGSNPITGVAQWDPMNNNWLSAYNHPNQLIRALVNYSPPGDSCKLFSGGEVALNQLKCATIIVDSFETRFVIFPNPAQNKLHIEIGTLNQSEYEITIYNLFGNKVLVSSLGQTKNLKELDISQLQNGLYLIELKGPSNKTWYQKFVKASD